jgi:signal transduction histidine kinase
MALAPAANFTSGRFRVASEWPQVLLVDDNQQLVGALRDLLSASGLDIISAYSVEQAQKLLEQLRPDLILCDIKMPVQLGYELYDFVKDDLDLSSIPFVFLTSVTEDAKRREAIEQGCDAYVLKPFDPDDLVSIIKGKLAVADRRKKLVQRALELDKKRIIHTLSHEFRTPLVSISTGSELLMEHGDSLDPKQLRVLLESIWRGGRRLERLIDDFMVLQQISLGHAEAVQKKYKMVIPVEGIVNSSVNAFKASLLGNQEVNFIIEPCHDQQGSKPLIFVYEVQISNALQRLMDNAYKFGSKEEPIRLSWKIMRDKEVVIRVRDHGRGLKDPQRTLDMACRTFSQIGRDLNEQQGCGLGLSIANYYTKINKGSLTLLHPKEGEGLVAELAFPLV